MSSNAWRLPPLRVVHHPGPVQTAMDGGQYEAREVSHRPFGHLDQEVDELLLRVGRDREDIDQGEDFLPLRDGCHVPSEMSSPGPSRSGPPRVIFSSARRASKGAAIVIVVFGPHWRDWPRKWARAAATVCEVIPLSTARVLWSPRMACAVTFGASDAHPRIGVNRSQTPENRPTHIAKNATNRKPEQSRGAERDRTVGL
jgi:hypothetical protein